MEVISNHFLAQKNRLTSLNTSSKVKILDGNDQWLWTVNHYDRKARLIQVVVDNHLGGKDIISTLYHDFNSRVEKRFIAVEFPRTKFCY